MPFFNENTMAKVWRESINSADAFGLGFIGPQEGLAKIDDLGPIIARMTLHIMNTTCFDHDGDCLAGLQDRETVSKDHKISYGRAMRSLIDHLQVFFITPRALLSPFQWLASSPRYAFDS